MNFKIIIIPTVIDIIIKLGFLEILVSDFNIIFTDISITTVLLSGCLMMIFEEFNIL